LPSPAEYPRIGFGDQTVNETIIIPALRGCSAAPNPATLEIQQSDMVRFDLVLTGDSMTGEVNMTGGQGPSGKANLNVTRAK
jgi:hypothetical protein